MKKCQFDNETFNRNYAYIYTLIQRVLLLGFLCAVVGIGLNAGIGITVSISDKIVNAVAVYFVISLVGFPIISVMKRGNKHLIRESKLFYDGVTVLYDKTVDKLWTAVGHIEEHHIYNIRKINEIKVNRFFYIIVGEIEKEVINNKRTLGRVNVNTVKIPRAYKDMERMIKNE